MTFLYMRRLISLLLFIHFISVIIFVVNVLIFRIFVNIFYGHTRSLNISSKKDFFPAGDLQQSNFVTCMALRELEKNIPQMLRVSFL